MPNSLYTRFSVDEKHLFIFRGRAEASQRRGGGGHAVFQEDLFGEDLAAFQLGGAFVWPEDPEVPGLKNVHDAGAQWRFGANDGEVDLLLGGERGQGIDVGGRDRHAFGQVGDAGVAGSSKEIRDPPALGEFPDQRVFAPAVSDDEDFHADFSRHCR